ncbi:hypothetical protein V2A60_000258 [Cordyceps javanica]
MRVAIVNLMLAVYRFGAVLYATSAAVSTIHLIKITVDQQCLRFLGFTFLNLVPLMYERIHARAVASARRRRQPAARRRVKRDVLMAGLLPAYLACTAMSLVSVGGSILGAGLLMMQSSVFAFMQFSLRERLEATWSCLFRPCAMALAILYRVGTPETKMYIPRAYELFTRFYLRLLTNPQQLFEQPAPDLFSYGTYQMIHGFS